jgi:hypothetical protein
MTKNLPTAKGVLETSLGKVEKREAKIDEIAKLVMGQIPADVMKQTPPARPESLQHVSEADIASRGETTSTTTPRPASLSTPKKEQLAESIAETAKTYQSEATRVAERGRDEELERQQKQKKSTKTKMPTSIWIPESAKKDILNLNMRTYDYKVKINVRGLMLFALKTLQTLPDSKIAEVMKEFDVDDRRKGNGEEE